MKHIRLFFLTACALVIAGSTYQLVQPETALAQGGSCYCGGAGYNCDNTPGYSCGGSCSQDPLIGCGGAPCSGVCQSTY
jgi:hypothetical protein